MRRHAQRVGALSTPVASAGQSVDGVEAPKAHNIQLGRRRGVSSGCDGGRVGPGLPPRVEFVVVGDAHEVAVPRGLKAQAPEPDFEPGWEGTKLPMEYLWPRYSVRITIERAVDEPIFSAYPPTWRANCRCGM
jgi:hypothetical protein